MGMTRLYAMMTVGLLLVSPAAAQQKPATAAEKEAAQQKAGEENMARMAAQQAEAVARAQLKVAQEEKAEQLRLEREAEEKRGLVIPLDIEVVISRYQGEKKVSSLPYALTVNAPYQHAGRLEVAPLTQLRMGGQVPLPTMAPAVGPDGKSITGFTGGGPIQYKEIGTSIDARGRWLVSPAGAFEVWISVQEDAVATPQGASATTLPVIRTLRASNNLVLRDGQTRQFTAAPDRITGEVVKVDVTLKVLK